MCKCLYVLSSYCTTNFLSHLSVYLFASHIVEVILIRQACCVCPTPFVFLLNTTEFVPSPLQLRLQALNANHSLQQVLVKISILLLQRPEYRGTQNIFIQEIVQVYMYTS